jgi:membrane fusion protein (multidrug efflux system)
MPEPVLKSDEMPAKTAEPVLKVVPAGPTVSSRAKVAAGFFRRYRRVVLLGMIPALAVIIGLTIYLMGGRYISTDNAYVGAQKVLITPDVAGKVISVFVKEGQHVNPGDKLLEIDPEPYRLALMQAQAKLDTVETQFNTLKSDLHVLTTLAQYSAKNIELKKRDVERKAQLAESRSGSQADLDKSASDLVTAQLQNQLALQRRDNTLAQLLGNPDLKIADFPAYAQAKAARDQAQNDLNHTTLRAPISGIATQVDNIQLGRFVTAGNPIFSVVDDAAPWVEANPKETDITYLRLGQHVTIQIDTFPDHVFHGSVISVSPGTGSQFSILPAQNASGNWIKVVQRVPLRIAFDATEDTSLLRSGMSATVEIDTGRNRSLLTLLGLTPKPSVKTSVP